MPEKAITKHQQVSTEAQQARQYLARLRMHCSKYVRYVAFLATLAQCLQLALIAVTAWLLSGWAAKTLAVADSIVWLAVALALILVRALVQRQSEQKADQLALNVEQFAAKALMQQWHQRAGTQVPSEEVSLLHDAIPALGSYFARFLPQLWLATLIPLVILLTAFSLDWIAALFLLLAAPLIPLFMALVGMGAERLNKQHFESVQHLSGLFIDRLRNVVGLTLFNRTGKAVAQIEKASQLSKQLNMKTLRVAFMSSAVLEFFTAVAIAAVAIYVGFALLGYYQYGPAAEMTWFVGLLLLMLAPEFFQPLRVLAGFYHDRAAALGAAELLALSEQRANDKQALSATREAVVLQPNHSYSLQLKQLVSGFTHDLHGPIHLTVQSGELLLLNGPSGAGKSTLLKTIAGLLAPRSGAVGLENGQHETQNTASLCIAYLAQQPFFQTGTLAANLQLMAPKASDNEMTKALVSMGLGTFFAQLPAGLNTPIGPNQYGLSGGEARRVALARIALAKQPLILLDEPTAGLDSWSAQAVINALQTLQQEGHILVVVSHDTAFERIATQSLTLEGGV